MFYVCYILTQRMSALEIFNDSALYKCLLNNNNNNNNSGDWSDTHQSIEVPDGCKCSNGQQAIGDRDGGVDGAASTDSGHQFGHEVRLHYLQCMHCIL